MRLITELLLLKQLYPETESHYHAIDDLKKGLKELNARFQQDLT